MIRIFKLLLLGVISWGSNSLASPEGERRFAIDDYFLLKQIPELAAATDGKWIAYAVERQSLVEDRTIREIYVCGTNPAAQPILIDKLRDIHELASIPGKRELAFLWQRDGSTQVYSYNLDTYEVRRLTSNVDSVVAFRFAPDARTLAYITQSQRETLSLYNRLQTSGKGLLIDPDVLRVQHFTDPSWRLGDPVPPRQLWIQLVDGKAIPAEVPGDIKKIQWASDSSRLSVTYDSGTPSTSLYAGLRKSIGIYYLDNRHFRILATGSMPVAGQPGMNYEISGWLPDEDKVIVQRARITDYFISARHPEWAIVDISKHRSLVDGELIWLELSLAGHDPAPIFHALTSERVLINKTIGGTYRSLYEVTEYGLLHRSEIAAGLQGNITLARISSDGTRAAFVYDSLDEAPEIFIWRRGNGSRQLTSVNADLSKRRTPAVREIHWLGRDGTEIQGWLLLPDEPSSPERRPWPLITFVHGGPSMPMPVGFAGYFQSWPYPLQVYALHGMAVFLPNYRGNTTYGRAFASPVAVDGAPVSDIIAGIENLIDQEIADPDHLAISGHSHGAWLASLVMTKFRRFQAASFAEGSGNKVTLYDLASGRINHELHDEFFGSSLYENPKRYLHLSPIFRFKGLTTAALFEAGSRSLAITMLGYPKAARHASMPAEFIVYPRAGHVLRTSPRLQKESATRNLDWFRFWLHGKEDLDVDKIDQYRRWRDMRQN